MPQARHHAVKFTGLADHDGNLVWLGTGYPGSTHDLTAARADDLFWEIGRADLRLYADKAYTGAGDRVVVPFKGRGLPEAKRQHNHVVNSVRALVERGFSVLKRWAIFRRARCCPKFLDQIGKAVLTLELN